MRRSHGDCNVSGRRVSKCAAKFSVIKGIKKIPTLLEQC
jgi:hypothetical protein